MQKPTVLFMSLGKSSHIVLSQIFKEINPSPKYIYLVHTHEITESYDISKAPQYLKDEIPKINASLSAIKEMMNKDLKGIEIKQILVSETDPATVRDTLIPYIQYHRDCSIIFHMSAGTTQLILSILTLALWTSAQVWITPQNKNNKLVQIPDPCALSENQKKIIRSLGKKYDSDPDIYVDKKDLAVDCKYLKSKNERLVGQQKWTYYNDLFPLLKEYMDGHDIKQSGLGLIEKNVELSEEAFRLTREGIYVWRLLHLENS